MKRFLIAASAACAFAAQASGLDALDNFIKATKSGRASFTQVVTAPSREGQLAKTRTSTGTFEFARPSKFRFDYRKPFEQLIVADGSTLWLFDADLNQVTARNQDAVLGSTPAALIASAGSTAALLRDFNLEAAPDKDGLQWAVATPKNRDGQLNNMRVGFRGNELAKLEIVDGFGQRSVITFDKMETNVAVAAERFHFKPPQGASVVKQ
ncbi:MAG TPA: outer membrane lipoprotein chaperone LolA [Ramlibacter sp.]|nr:outer membrane lipoprotein chaperone LolA [Ramlibacter sp.]